VSERAGMQEAAEQCGIPVVTWEAMLAFGESSPAPPTPGNLDSLCTIMYTSGTTGEPKGVEITHRAVLATIGALHRLLLVLDFDLGCARSLLPCPDDLHYRWSAVLGMLCHNMLSCAQARCDRIKTVLAQ
jgi:acyl-coenzyme A synthetase/AMP-(fatty) acid ligase